MLAEIRADIEEQLSFLRAVQRLLESYAVAFETADETEIKDFKKWIQTKELDKIRIWLKLKVTEEPTVRQLRIEASRQNIVGYGRMSKAGLLSALYGTNQNHIGKNLGSKASA